MAIEDEDPTEEPAAPQPGAASPALQDFRSAFTDPDAQGWAGEVTTRLNDYFQRRQIVDDAAAKGQEFVQNIDQFKGGLVSMVQADPHAVHTALDLVPSTMAALINNMPGGPPDNAEDHHTALVGHMQQEIAAAAVTSAAEVHAPLARSLLADDRISGVLGDDAQHLSTYTDMQEAARTRDAAAAQGQALAARQEIADQSGRNYLTALVDPNTGKPRSPPQWNQAVMADMNIPPKDKVLLFNAHEQLGRNGDVATDPHATADMIHQIAAGALGQNSIYPRLGANLSMADAGTMIQAVHEPGFAKQLSDTVADATGRFAPHGDIAETNALGRFINYLLPAVRSGAVLDPHSEDYILNNVNPDQFRVTGTDLLLRSTSVMNSPAMGMVGAGMGRGAVAATAELMNTRPTLEAIFSRATRGKGPPLEDYGAIRNRPPPSGAEAPPPPIDTAREEAIRKLREANNQ